MELSIVKQAWEESRPNLHQLGMDITSFNREMEWGIQMFQANPYLLKMDGGTVKNALVNLALTGLTLNPILKEAYLVPRKGKCCVDPSYMGLIKIMTDTGSVKSIKAKPVYLNEPFDIEQGTNGYVKHGICKTGDKGKRIGAYSIAELHDGSTHVEWMYEEQLMDIKKRSEAVKADKVSPWKTDEDEMIRKTVIKRHWKFLPKSERAMQVAQAIAFDDEANGIDFKKEKDNMEAAARQAAHNPAATPGAPTEEALATDEDFEEIFKYLNDEALGEFFIGMPKIKVSIFKAKMQEYRDGKSPKQLTKSEAEKYIQFGKYEVQEANKKKADQKTEPAA